VKRVSSMSCWNFANLANPASIKTLSLLLLLAAARGAHASDAAAGALAPKAATVAAKEPESDERKPSDFAVFCARLAPREILAGPQAGVSASKFRTSTEYAALIRPTEADRGTWVAPSFGAVLTARWATGISLTLAPRRETYGVRTREQTVSFPDNPFPHTLKSNLEMGYNVWPVLLGMGWFTGRQHLQMQVGAYKAYLDHADLEWTVDGEAYANRPAVSIRDSYTGWMLGTEYGFRLGSGELTLGVETQRVSDSMMEGLKGSIRAESAQVRLAYLWTLMRK